MSHGQVSSTVITVLAKKKSDLYITVEKKTRCKCKSTSWVHMHTTSKSLSCSVLKEIGKSRVLMPVVRVWVLLPYLRLTYEGNLQD